MHGAPMTGRSPEAEEKPKLAEERYKNIQMLKGVPAARLVPMMQSFTRVAWNALTPKHTARNMMKMAQSINGANR